MQRVIILLSFAVLLLFVTGAAPKVEPFISGGNVVWSDEFEGNALDLEKWNIETGTGAQYGLTGWGNNEKQFYKPENVSVQNGVLVLEARKDNNDRNIPYTSGKISTGGIMNHDGVTKKQIYAVKPGERIEARIKSSRGEGLWPAFWLIGATSNNLGGYKALGWPRCGEIDILEIKGGQENRLISTIHYGQSWDVGRGNTGDFIDLSYNLADDWHVYGVTWDKDSLHFLLDGKIWQSIDLAQLEKDNKRHRIKEAFTAKSGFVININFAVGGDFIGGKIPADSIFTSGPVENRRFLVDWVRVYSK